MSDVVASKPKKKVSFVEIVDDVAAKLALEDDVAAKPALVFSEPAKIKKYNCLMQQIIRLANTAADAESKIFANFFGNFTAKYSLAERKNFYLSEGGSIIYWALVSATFTVANLTLILNDMQSCNTITEAINKEGFGSLKSVLRGQMRMIQNNFLPKNRKDMFVKVKILIDKCDAAKEFLKQNLESYFLKQEIQENFSELAVDATEAACQP